MNTLFDTNILIDAIKQLAPAIQEIERHDEWAISLVTWIEVMTGGETPSQEEQLRQYLTQFRVLHIDNAVAEEAAIVRRTYRLRLPDALIFATARVSGRTLVTRNTKDFGRIESGILVPYVL